MVKNSVGHWSLLVIFLIAFMNIIVILFSSNKCTLTQENRNKN